MEENNKISENNIDKRLKNLRPPYAKGESGNPNGRPVGQRNYATIYKDALTKLATINGQTIEELEDEIISAGIIMARKGDYKYYKDVLDRIHGTAVNKVDAQLKANIQISFDSSFGENKDNE